MFLSRVWPSSSCKRRVIPACIAILVRTPRPRGVESKRWRTGEKDTCSAQALTRFLDRHFLLVDFYKGKTCKNFMINVVNLWCVLVKEGITQEFEAVWTEIVSFSWFCFSFFCLVSSAAFLLPKAVYNSLYLISFVSINMTSTISNETGELKDELQLKKNLWDIKMRACGQYYWISAI